jgi:hypothetical protein
MFVVVDPDYIQYALKMQVPLQESIATYLEAEVVPSAPRESIFVVQVP